MSLTRWQSFRRQHRHSPVKQAFYLTGFVLFMGLYAYAFFYRQQDRSHATIETWNTALQEKARIEWADRRAKRIRAKEIREEKQQAKKKSHQQDGSNENDDDDDTNSTTKRQYRERTFADRLIDMILVSYAMSLMMRVYARLHPHSTTTSTTPRHGRSFFRHHRLLQQRRQERFRQWADRLNAQRRAYGQAPISLASLELVMRERDMTGDDYDNLLQFDQEAGPAMEALLNGGMGASQDEINRCPLRTLEPDDELLQNRTENGLPLPHCAICLEPYHAGDQVRTIPCFHSFHKNCVDPWLSQRAVCPVCKHSAIG